MKKIFFLIALTLSALAVNAQSLTPRYGIVPGDDNTGRVLTYKYKTIADAIGNDTISISQLNAWETTIVLTVRDSVTVKTTDFSRSYLGDQVKFIFKNISGGTAKVKFISPYFVCATANTQTVSIPTSYATAKFSFTNLTSVFFWFQDYVSIL